MQKWLQISLILCVFGFLKQMRPSEPFAYNFLTGPWKNFTDTEVSQEIFPVGTYSNVISLIIVFLITDISRYKPIVVVLGVTASIGSGMLIWTKSYWDIIISQVFYGIFLATEVAYYTYIYAKVDKEHYQQVTSHTRAAILAGRTLSGVISQIVITFQWMNYMELNYITLASEILATIWSLFLPSVNKSIYFHQKTRNTLTLRKKIEDAFILMKTHLVNAYSNNYVLKWSIWWALTTCGCLQTDTYIQTLYGAILDDPDAPLYNGAVEAALTLLGFLGAMLAGFSKINWQEKGELTLPIFSLMQGIFLIISARTSSIFVCYSFYILFGFLFNFIITIASTQIALFIDEDSYGLVFGINTFLALIFSTIMTLFVATKGVGFSLKPQDQYFVFGCYHLIISIIFITIGIRSWIQRRRLKKEEMNGKSDIIAF